MFLKICYSIFCVGGIFELAALPGCSTGVTLVADLTKRGYKLRCKECNPPVGERRQQCHKTHAHNGGNPPYHIFTVNQSPVLSGWRCFDKRITVPNNPNYPEFMEEK